MRKTSIQKWKLDVGRRPERNPRLAEATQSSMNDLWLIALFKERAAMHIHTSRPRNKTETIMLQYMPYGSRDIPFQRNIFIIYCSQSLTG